MELHEDLELAARRNRSRDEPSSTVEEAVTPAHLAHAVADPSSAAPATLLHLQRLAGNATVRRLIAGEEEVPPERSPVLDVVGRGGGRPLEPALRTDMEHRLGADFGDVRVHTDTHASASAEAVNAHAYTVGSDVVFRSERWNPDSTDGRHTLAHELAHVVQQRSGPVDGTSTGDGVRISDPHDTFEQAADRTATAAMAGPASVAPIASVAVSRTAAGDEEDEAQRLAVSRKKSDDEDEDEAEAEA